MKLRFSNNNQISARTALLSLALCISLSACKTQSTSSQSSSGMPASKPPSSSPSASSPSSSPSSMPSGGNTRPASRVPSSTTSADSGQQSSSESSNGQDREQGSSSGLPSSPGPESSGPQNSGEFEDGGSETSGAGAADSPLYEQYDPASDGDADVSDASTSPGARAETADISFDESTAAAGGNGQSTAERQASLEAELEGSFGRYDGMILRERDKVLADGAARGAEDQLEQEDPGFGQGDGTSEGGNSPYGAPNTQSGADSSNSGDGQGPAARGENNGDYQGAKGKPANNGLPPVPDDIPDGSDDDIVARQIREAAMAEKDPKLREKLWEEYRKYKQR